MNNFRIQLSNLSKIYYGNSQAPTKALENVAYCFNEPGMYFIVGPSGCGKTTLLNVLGGLDTPTSGDIRINGKSTKKYTSRQWDKYRNRHIGFVFQDYGLIEDYTVYKNVELALELQYKLNKKKQIDEILKNCGLSVDKKRKPNELSGGQKQRVAIARALIKEPDIVLADEPTGNLDSKTSEQIFDYLKEYSYNHIVIVVSHSMLYAEKYADKIIHMQDGKIEKVDKQDYEIEDEDLEEIVEDGIEVDNLDSKKPKRIKTKGMSTKSSIGYAFKNIKTNAFRYLTAFLLFVIMTILAQIGIIANRYDKIETQYRTVINSGLTNIEISNDDYWQFNEDETDILYEAWGNEYVAISNTISDDAVDDIETINKEAYEIYSTSNKQKSKASNYRLSNVALADKEYLEKVGFNLIAGSWPKQYCDCVITKKDADDWIDEYGFGKGEYGRIIDVWHQLDLESYGKRSKRVYICGVIDTGYDEAITQAEISIKKDLYYETNLDRFKTSENNKRIHHTMFVGEYFMYRYYELFIPLRFYQVEHRSIGYDAWGYSYKDFAMSKSFYDDLVLVNGDTVEYFFMDGYDENTPLKNNEIVVPINGTYYYGVNMEINVFDVSANTYLNDRERFDNEMNKIIAKMNENPIVLRGNFETSNYETIPFNHIDEEDISGKLMDITKDYKVVGFYINATYSSELYVLVNDDVYLDYADYHVGISALLVDFAHSSKKSDVALLNWLDTNGTYTLNHLYTNDLEIADERAQTLKTIGLEVAIVFGLIGVVVIFSMFIAMINKNTRQLGIFRALGASKYNMMGIYLFQSMLLFVVTIVVASLLLPLTTSFAQGSNGLGIFAPIFKDAATLESASSSYSIELIDVLHIESADYLMMIGFAFSTILLSTIIPIFYKLNKKPIDLMRTKDD